MQPLSHFQHMEHFQLRQMDPQHTIHFLRRQFPAIRQQIRYISKVKKLGFDILEISCAMLKDISDEKLKELRHEAKAEGVILTAGYGPNASENLASADPEVVKHAIAFYTDILKKLEILDIHTLGGGVYSYWPVDYSKPIERRATGHEVLKMCAGSAGSQESVV